MKNKLGGLDNLAMMSLWKRFKMNREMEGEDQKYAQSTSGPGSNAKKQMLLRAWLIERWWPAAKTLQAGSGCL